MLSLLYNHSIDINFERFSLTKIFTDTKNVCLRQFQLLCFYNVVGFKRENVKKSKEISQIQNYVPTLKSLMSVKSSNDTHIFFSLLKLKRYNI